MARARALLSAAQKPVVLAGGGDWSAEAVAAFVRFAERFDLPVAASFRRATLFPNDHSCYVGELGLGANAKLRKLFENADLILSIGGRMAEVPSQGYALFEIPNPQQKLIHVHPDSHEIGRVYSPELGIIASSRAFALTLEALQAPPVRAWAPWRAQARQDYLQWTEVAPRGPGATQLGDIMIFLRERLPADAIIANGAGNFTIWIGRFLRFRQFATQLAPVSGSMGYGAPAAVAAKRLYPDRLVVCFCGDGDFLMNGQEFATAVQYDLAIVVVVIDNGMYGTIRMHQERRYPGRETASFLRNPDFAAYARAFGGHGETVERTEDFAPAFERALASGRPAIVHVRVDPQAITPTATLDGLRQAALNDLKA
jgi:acetolactate synthase-1/2/3 large subunit